MGESQNITQDNAKDTAEKAFTVFFEKIRVQAKNKLKEYLQDPAVKNLFNHSLIYDQLDLRFGGAYEEINGEKSCRLKKCLLESIDNGNFVKRE